MSGIHTREGSIMQANDGRGDAALFLVGAVLCGTEQQLPLPLGPLPGELPLE